MSPWTELQVYWSNTDRYHNMWFDGERYVRALAGIVIIVLGIVVT